MAKRNNKAKFADVVIYFTTTYGTDLDRLIAFQQLCRDLEVEVGTSLSQCKKVLDVALFPTDLFVDTASQNVKNAKVNIYDFVRVKKTGGKLSAIKFSSKTKLRQDAMRLGRKFPLQVAKTNEFLTAMLIDVDNH